MAYNSKLQGLMTIQLKKVWPLVKSGTAAHFYLALTPSPVFMLFKTGAEAERAKVTPALQKADATFRPTAVAVGTIEMVDHGLVLSAIAAKSAQAPVNAVTKSLVILAKELIAAGMTDLAAATKGALYQIGPAKDGGGGDEGDDEDEGATQLTLNYDDWKKKSSRMFSRRSAALKAIDRAFGAYDPKADEEERITALTVLSRAIQDWLDSKEGSSSRMSEVQELAIQVARERDRLVRALDDAPVVVQGTPGFSEALVRQLAQTVPSLHTADHWFAIAPSRGKPVLWLQRAELDGGKAREQLKNADVTFDPSLLYVGKVRKGGAGLIFEIHPDSSVGQPNISDARTQLLRIAGNRALNRAVSMSVLTKVEVTIEGMNTGSVIQTAPSETLAAHNSTFTKLSRAAGLLKGQVSGPDRDRTAEVIRTAAGDWLDKNAKREHPADADKRKEAWLSLKLSQDGVGATSRKELRVAGREFARELAEIQKIPNDPVDKPLQALLQLRAELEQWLKMARTQTDRAAVLELTALHEQTQRAIDALPDEVPDEVADPTLLDAALDELDKTLDLYVAEADLAEREKIKGVSTFLAECKRLADMALRHGLRPQAARADLLAKMFKCPASREKGLEWKPVLRVEFKGAVARVGLTVPPNKTAEGLEDELFKAAKQAINKGDRLRADDARQLLDVGYTLQQLREANFTVFRLLCRLAPGVSNQSPPRTATPEYSDYEKIEDAFGEPVAREQVVLRRQRRADAGHKLVQRPNFRGYDTLFTPTKVNTLKGHIQNKSPGDAVKSMLEDNDFPGVTIGEVHNSPDSKKFIVDNLESFKDAGVDTLYIEQFRVDEHQDDLDAYFKTGKMPEALAQYLKFQEDKHGVPFPDDLRGLLEKAQELGLRVRGIDSMDAKADPEVRDTVDKTTWTEQRVARMNALADDVITNDQGRKGKYIVLAGQAHNNTHRGGSEGIPGLSQLQKIPAVNVKDGALSLATEEPDARSHRPRKADAAVLLSTTLGTAKRTAIGHEMLFQINIENADQPEGEDYAPGEAHWDFYQTVNGIRLEWWERIVVHWDFDATNLDAQGIQDSQRQGVGGSKKAWADLLPNFPSSQTYDGWTEAVDLARKGTLPKKATITIKDKPGILIRAKRYSKRTLEFRHVVKDAHGKKIEALARQILVVEDGKIVYSLYVDSAGHNEELRDGAYTTPLGNGEATPTFDVDDDLPNLARTGAAAFVASARAGEAEAFEDKELDAFDAVFIDDPVSRNGSYQKMVKNQSCAMPLARQGYSYVQGAAPGGLYVALLNPRSDVERLYFTTDVTWKDVKTCGGCQQDSTIPCRQFIELPIEDYA